MTERAPPAREQLFSLANALIHEEFTPKCAPGPDPEDLTRPLSLFSCCSEVFPLSPIFVQKFFRIAKPEWAIRSTLPSDRVLGLSCASLISRLCLFFGTFEIGSRLRKAKNRGKTQVFLSNVVWFSFCVRAFAHMEFPFWDCANEHKSEEESFKTYYQKNSKFYTNFCQKSTKIAQNIS